MKKRLLPVLSALAATIFLSITAAHAATDLLWLYSSWFSPEAVQAAIKSEPVVKMSADETSAYRLGYAAGYDAATINAGKEYASDSPLSLATTRAYAPKENNLSVFIINTETNKFHDPSCASVDSILPEHRKEVHGTVEEVRQMGYIPCGRCMRNAGK